MIKILDIVGALLAFLATVYFVRANPIAWALSLIAISIDTCLYLLKGIYGDATLQAVYLVMCLYGWYEWRFGGKNHAELPIRTLTAKTTALLILISVCGVSVATFLLKTYTNSTVPYIDAITTVCSLVAQWLLCRKIIENWVLWFIVDSLYVGMYFMKGIPMHALLNIVYLGMAVAGYLNWKKLQSTRNL